MDRQGYVAQISGYHAIMCYDPPDYSSKNSKKDMSLSVNPCNLHSNP